MEAFEPSTSPDPRNNCGSGAFGFLCVNQTATSISIPVVAGRSYNWWVSAYDASSSTSATSVYFSIAPNVADTTFPTVAIAWPTASATVEGVLPINLTASDDAGVTRAVWYVDGTLLQEYDAAYGTVLTPPYTTLWDTRAYAKGAHTLAAIVSDAAGNSTYTSLSINVNNDTPPCIAPSATGADDVAINAALSAPNAAAVLCPDKTYYLLAPITFAAAGQKLYTQGFPSGAHRARLVVSGGSSFVTAVKSADLSGLSLRNVELDGNRGTAPHTSGGWALVELGGNASDLFVDSIKAYDPRGWSALHIFEGYVPSSSSCRRAVVTHNELGPSGHPNDGNWADGLSLACRDSFAAWNTVTDATDGAIVVFGSPGSLVTSNSIRAFTRKLFGGINMVDWDPYSGDYHGTEVRQNTIDANGAPILAGIAMGRNVWGCDTDGKRNIGGAVRSNVVQGSYMGYGYPANGVSDWTVVGNTSSATHSGVPVGCPGRPSATPTAFQKDYYQTGYTFQAEYVNGSVEYSPGLNVSGPVDKALSDSVAVSGLGGAQGSSVYYTFYVPSGTASVTFQTSGGSGDSDLYVSRNEAPTDTQFLCRPYTSTTNETCKFTSPVPGTYYVMLRGYTAFNGVSLSASMSRWFISGQVLPGISALAGSQFTYTLDVPAGTHFVTANLNGGSGDADLYVKVGAPPTLSSYDCRPYVSGNTEQCALNVAGPTTVYLMLNGYTDFAGTTLNAYVQ